MLLSKKVGLLRFLHNFNNSNNVLPYLSEINILQGLDFCNTCVLNNVPPFKNEYEDRKNNMLDVSVTKVLSSHQKIFLVNFTKQ